VTPAIRDGFLPLRGRRESPAHDGTTATSPGTVFLQLADASTFTDDQYEGTVRLDLRSLGAKAQAAPAATGLGACCAVSAQEATAGASAANAGLGSRLFATSRQLAAVP
jgi:hypothetical protein